MAENTLVVEWVDLFFAIAEAAKSFDQLFGSIASVATADSIPAESLHLRVSPKVFTDIQCHALKQLCGHLRSAQTASASLQFALTSTSTTASSSSSSTSPTPTATQFSVADLHQLLLSKAKAELRDSRRTHALQEFLVNELVRNEDLDNRLREKEEELVTVSAEVVKLKRGRKKGGESSANSASNPVVVLSGEEDSAVDEGAAADDSTPTTPASSKPSTSPSPSTSTSHQASANKRASLSIEPRVTRGVVITTLTGSSGKKKKAPTDPADDHDHYIHQFIRKAFGSDFFFGIIVSYNAPYYKVCQ